MMRNSVSVLSTILIFLVTVSFSQEMTSVAAKDLVGEPDVYGSVIEITNPNVENIVFRSGEELTEKLVLSFMLQAGDVTQLDNMLLEFTAYRGNGKVLGKSIWPLKNSDPAIVSMGDEARLEFEIAEKSFADAAKFTVAIRPNDRASLSIGTFECPMN